MITGAIGRNEPGFSDSAEINALIFLKMTSQQRNAMPNRLEVREGVSYGLERSREQIFKILTGGRTVRRHSIV